VRKRKPGNAKWLKTPAGRAHIKRMLRKSHSPEVRAKAAATRRETMKRAAADRKAIRSALGITDATQPRTTHDNSELPDHVVSYALGHVEAWLQIYAASHRVPVSSLAHRLGALLQAASRR